MADIQVIDFLKEVESNRRSLIANAQSKGKIIDNGASLTQAVAINNTIEPSASPEKIEVRFFDADGTLLKQEFIDYGGSVTPPPNPSYDPERLTFKRWASAIGERFDNITHDVDYGALYTVNNGGFHIFCTFNDNTGYTVTLSPYQTDSHTITIEWGDGTPNSIKTNTGSTNISHTYAQAGDYEIIVTRDVDIFEYSSDYWYLGNYLLATSRNQDINNAVNKAYMKCMFYNNFNNTDQNVYTVVTENLYNTNSFYCNSVKNIVLNNSLSVTYIVLGENNSVVIVDNSINCNLSCSIINLDKLIVPQNSGLNNFGNLYKITKLISLSNNLPPFFNNAYSLEKIQLLSNNISVLPTIGAAYNVKEYIFPNSIVEINDSLAPYSKLKSITIPQNAEIVNNIFTYMFNLYTINLPQNFNQSFTIFSYDFSINSFIDILNKVQDNTGETSQTITISQEVLLMSMFKIYVVLDNGIWVQANRTTPNAMTLVEAFNSKNWTIS